MRSNPTSTRLPLVIGALGAASLILVLWLFLEPRAQSEPTGTRHLLPVAGAPAPATLPEAPAPLPDPDPAAARPIEAPVVPMGPDMIIVRVIDAETRLPVASYEVAVVPHDGTPPLPRVTDIVLRTDNPVPVRSATGIYKTERKPGHWDVVVRAPDYEPGIALDLAVPPLDARPAEIAMSHGPGLTGLVHDTDGQPVPDVAVFLLVEQLVGEQAPPTRTTVRTGPDGRFRFSPLPPGQYSIALLEPGNRNDRLGGLVVEKGTTDVSAFLAPRHNVTFQVQDPSGRPVPGIEVELRGESGIASARTTDSGQATVRWVADGSYALNIHGEGWQPLQDDLALSGGQGEQVRWITLQPSGG